MCPPPPHGGVCGGAIYASAYGRFAIASNDNRENLENTKMAIAAKNRWCKNGSSCALC